MRVLQSAVVAPAFPSSENKEVSQTVIVKLILPRDGRRSNDLLSIPPALLSEILKCLLGLQEL